MKTYKRVSYNPTELPPERPLLPLEEKFEWIVALRSGEYKQGTQYLCRDDAYCCLGVKCALDEKAGKCTATHGSFGVVRFYGMRSATLPDNYPILGDCGNLPVRVIFDHNDSYSLSLASLNDAGATFDEIAWLIEELF